MVLPPGEKISGLGTIPGPPLHFHVQRVDRPIEPLEIEAAQVVRNDPGTIGSKDFLKNVTVCRCVSDSCLQRDNFRFKGFDANLAKQSWQRTDCTGLSHDQPEIIDAKADNLARINKS
jgi:hypothetical protein